MPEVTQESLARALATIAALEASFAFERSMFLDDFLANGGRVHTKVQCNRTMSDGGPDGCVIHRPTPHVLSGSRQILRSSGLVEDQCSHGVGHPNPDSVAYLNWANDQRSWGVHGCDGCCRSPERQEPEADPGWPPQ